MFGTIVFGITPFATSGEVTDEVFNPWVEQCKSDDEWEISEKPLTDVRRCEDAT